MENSLQELVTDKVVEQFFLSLPNDGLEHIFDAITQSLKMYTDDPTVVPPRIIKDIETNNGNHVTHIIMPVIANAYVGVKTLFGSPDGLQGSITITDPHTGKFLAVFEAKEMTAIRTAIVSCIPLNHRFLHSENENKLRTNGVINIVIFGTGLQARWHALICLKVLLSIFSSSHHKTIDITFFYHTKKLNEEEFKKRMSKAMYSMTGSPSTSINININQVKLEDKKAVCSHVKKSNIIFGCIPSLEPHLLFQDLNAADAFEGSNAEICKETYISLIGSYRPSMHECDNELIQEFQKQGVKIIVDSKEHTLAEAGELISNDVQPNELKEYGTVFSRKEQDDSKSMIKLGNGREVTLHKIVGLAVMDVALAAVTKEYLTDQNYMR
ncbi:uncharacterized protein NDAI_0H03490 [Naumovozyma dairenensis CBS 421]|uniref:Uncharacterized protein n=1 Tax=Naumovozyma dairenensis (strain ATCC 10597 / BCRC 20456 / CBS 421 / NBRC 0211 / NRRL Y-12639) TaxID=1071378 RepID=G0WFG1_NAUDC|nr:hypothetical protein NDAI_0H03490 [Naumovozyma dairenensis CBS 421]CCD26522.1 hypothetical protein NDAI_0H03490 [Naumovozyma dairenensis CBS 421]